MKKNMTEGKEWKLILFFTLPIMATNLLQQVYNTADGIIVGNFVGEAAFSAVRTCQPLTFLFLAFAMGLSVGVGVVISQTFGAKRHDELPEAIDTALLLLGAVGLVLTVAAVLLVPFLLTTILAVPEKDGILSSSIVYMRIYAAGLFFQFIYNGISAMLRGLGNSKTTLLILLTSSIVNIVLDFIFVAFWNWGVTGAAVATTFSQIMSAVLSYIYLRRHFPVIKSGVHFNRKMSSQMIRLGLPLAIQQSVVAFGNGAMQRLVNSFEATVPGVIAAFGAGNNLDSFVFVPIMGFQAGLANFTGQNVGAGRFDRVRRGYRVSLIMSLAITILICVLLYIFAGNVISLFGLSDESLVIGVEQIRYLTRFFWMFSAYMTLGGLLQGAGDTILQSSATLTALVVRIITSYTLVHFGVLGYNAAWATTPIGWTCALVITYIRFFSGGWKKKAITGAVQPEPDTLPE